MKSANKGKIFRKLTALVLCVATVFTSINGLGGVLKNIIVDGAVEKCVFPVYLYDYNESEINKNDAEVKFGGSLKDYIWNRCDGLDSYSVSAPAYAVQGIVKSELVNGLPVFAHKCNDLFSLNECDGKTIVYPSSSSSKQVGLEFYQENGYYVVDSDCNDYTYDYSSGIIKQSSSNKKGFWPFGSNNWYFGMNFSVNFNITADGKTNGQDTVFEFSGDDDVWVFIDGKLVLDMGGIHKRVTSSMNFCKDTFTINNVSDENNGGAAQTGTISNRLGYSSAEEMLSSLSTGEHTLSVFYLERGGYESNCMIKFNFSDVTSSIPTDVYFEKVDEEDAALEGAEFGLFESEYSETPLYTAVSSQDSEKNVIFKNVKSGTYYLKETKAPTGYEMDYTTYVVEVVNGTSKVEKGKYVTTEGSFTIKKNSDDIENITKITNKVKSNVVVEADKTSVVSDWDAREYVVTVSGNAAATTSFTETETIVTAKPINMILSFDMSRSMLFPADLKFYGNYKISKLPKKTGISYYYIDDSTNATVYEVKYINKKWMYKDSSSEAWREISNTDVKKDFYTKTSDRTRLEILKIAAKEMIDELPDGSVVSIVTFANNEDVNLVQKSKVTINDAGRTEIKAAIDALNVSLEGGTNQKVGLELAKGELAKMDGKEDSYVVLLSDGCLNASDVSKKDVKSVATKIKDEKATIFTIGLALKLGGKTEDAETLLKEVASCEEYYFNANSTDDLSDVLKSIVTTAIEKTNEGIEIKYLTYKATDIIDNRFELTEESRKDLIDNGATVTDNADGTTTIVWAGLKNEFKKSFVIRAKDTYIGGNNISTNALYKVETEYEGTSYEKQVSSPKVNVKITVNAKHYEDTVFLGETLGEELANGMYFTDDKYSGMIGLISGCDTRDVVVTYQWFESSDNTNWNLIVTDDIKDYIRKIEAKTLDTMYFKCVTTVNAKVSDSSAEAVAAAVSQEADKLANRDGEILEHSGINHYATGTYTVYVVEGKLTITKNQDRVYLDNVPYEAWEKERIDAKQTTVFIVKRYAKGTTDFKDENVLETYEVAITPEVKDSVTIAHLKAGEYVVEEQTAWSFKYDLFDIDRTHVVTIGNKSVDGTIQTYASGTESFTNLLKNEIMFTDSCNTVNVFEK